MPRISKTSQRQQTPGQPLSEPQLKEVSGRVGVIVETAKTEAVAEAVAQASKVRSVQASSYVFSHVSLNAAAQVDSSDLRGVNGVAANAIGVYLHVGCEGAGGTYTGVAVAPHGVTPNQYSPQVWVGFNWPASAVLPVGLSSAGRISMRNVLGSVQAYGIYVAVVGYWT
jgi:nitrate reductase NapAB chaperone NapD